MQLIMLFRNLQLEIAWRPQLLIANTTNNDTLKRFWRWPTDNSTTSHYEPAVKLIITAITKNQLYSDTEETPTVWDIILVLQNITKVDFVSKLRFTSLQGYNTNSGWRIGRLPWHCDLRGTCLPDLLTLLLIRRESCATNCC